MPVVTIVTSGKSRETSVDEAIEFILEQYKNQSIKTVTFREGDRPGDLTLVTSKARHTLRIDWSENRLGKIALAMLSWESTQTQAGRPTRKPTVHEVAHIIAIDEGLEVELSTLCSSKLTVKQLARFIALITKSTPLDRALRDAKRSPAR